VDQTDLKEGGRGVRTGAESKEGKGVGAGGGKGTLACLVWKVSSAYCLVLVPMAIIVSLDPKRCPEYILTSLSKCFTIFCVAFNLIPIS
jgi:hypothetical protein